MGQANESVGRIQEQYIARATSSWLESLERSLAQMKEYTVRLDILAGENDRTSIDE